MGFDRGWELGRDVCSLQDPGRRRVKREKRGCRVMLWIIISLRRVGREVDMDEIFRTELSVGLSTDS